MECQARTSLRAGSEGTGRKILGRRSRCTRGNKLFFSANARKLDKTAWTTGVLLVVFFFLYLDTVSTVQVIKVGESVVVDTTQIDLLG